MLDAKVDVNAQEVQGRTALLYACQEGHDDLAGDLIAAKADLSLRRPDGASCMPVGF